MTTKALFLLNPPRCLTLWFGVAAGLLLTALLANCASPPKKPMQPVTVALPSALSEKARLEQQQAILKIRDQTLRQLSQLKPPAKVEVEQAAGYGVFEVNGLNAVLAQTHGRGMVVEKVTGKVAYMQLARTDLRLGATVQPYRQVLVFRNPQKLSRFVASGSPADASSDPDIKVYRLNEKGVSVQADWGARYFRDPDLN